MSNKPLRRHHMVSDNVSNAQSLDPMLRANQCAVQLGIGLSTWWRWVQQGRVKRPEKLSARVSVWRSSYIAQLQNGLVGQEG